VSEPLGYFESPGAFVSRTGLGVDQAWKKWNAWNLSQGHEGLTRDQFRAAVRQYAGGK